MLLFQEKFLHAATFWRWPRSVTFDMSAARLRCSGRRNSLKEIPILAVHELSIEQTWWQRLINVKYVKLHIRTKGYDELVPFKLCVGVHETLSEIEVRIKALIAKPLELAVQRIRTHVESFEVDRDNTLTEDRYVRGSTYEKFLSRFDEANRKLALDVSLLTRHPMASEVDATDKLPLLLERFAAAKALLDRADTHRKNHNEKVMADQATTHAAYFKGVESTALSPNQITASLTFDDGNLTIAAAGSGKTSVIVAKVGLAVKTQVFNDDEILVLAFNKKAAKEIQERINGEKLTDQVGRKVTVKAATFHSYGLRLWLMSQGRQKGFSRPKLLNFDENGKSGRRLIVETLQELLKSDESFQKLLFDWIALHRYPIPVAVAANGLDEEALAVQEDRYRALCHRYIRTPRPYWDTHVPTFDATAFVRSFEEARIFNWLYLRRINFEYERFAPGWVRDAINENLPAQQQVDQYQPDFTYDNPVDPNKRYYHEHFGLGADGKAPHFLGGDVYVARANHKRSVLKKLFASDQRKTGKSRFLETTSADFRSGKIFEKLSRSLAERDIPVGVEDSNLKAQALASFGESDELIDLVTGFIAKFRDYGLTFDDIRLRVKELDSANAARAIAFLDWIEVVESLLRAKIDDAGLMDYAMMIAEATRLLNASKNPSFKIKFVLVDEFQDISRSRAQLVQAILNQHPDDSMLYCVGDDWQAINRFAGSDISIFKHMHEVSKHGVSTTVDVDESVFRSRSTHPTVLDTTYRCDQGIASISKEFVMGGGRDEHVDKPVTALRESSAPVIRVVEHADDGDSRVAALRSELMRIAALNPVEFEKDGQPKISEVFVLTRNRSEKSLPIGLSVALLKGLHDEFLSHGIDVRWESMHGSKGLGRTYVVMVGMDAGSKGYPRDFADDPILQLVLPPRVDAWDEERRLFYVGLTRAKFGVTLLCAATRPSIFIHELENSRYAEKIEWVRLPNVTRTICPSCKRSWLIRRETNAANAFVGCLRYPFCGYRASCEKHPDVPTIA